MNFGDANHLGPAITLFAGAGVVLGADVFTDRRAPARSLALLTILLAALCAVIGVWVFGVPFRGSILALLAISSAFLMPALGLGLFTANGTLIALDAGMPAIVAVLMGVITGTLASAFAAWPTASACCHVCSTILPATPLSAL